MIGIDTNVLLRCLLSDDAQAERAICEISSARRTRTTRLMSAASRSLEIVWVLEAGYRSACEQTSMRIQDLDWQRRMPLLEGIEPRPIRRLLDAVADDGGLRDVIADA